jgi:hypothetical protein
MNSSMSGLILSSRSNPCEGCRKTDCGIQPMLKRRVEAFAGVWRRCGSSRSPSPGFAMRAEITATRVMESSVWLARVVGLKQARIGYHGVGRLPGERDMALMDIQYISDEEGNPTGVIVPIDLWREIASERETAYLLQNEAMKRRLLEARERREGIPFDEVRKKLGV